MKNTEFQIIFANIAASYAKRELDRSVYDRAMSTVWGRRLVGLDQNKKYALEFVTYCIAAVTVQSNSDAGAIRTFINNILADTPTEIAKRVFNGSPKVCPDHVRGVLAKMTDDEISVLVQNIKPFKDSGDCIINDSPHSRADETSTLSNLAERIDQSRRGIQEKRRERK